MGGRHTLEGLLVDPIGGARPGALTIEDDLIVEVEYGDAREEPLVFPGFVDLHVYAPETLMETGVTGYLLTAREPVETTDPLCLGLHLEGPFLNPEAAGALPPDELRPVDLDLLAEWLAPGNVRLVTVSPELPFGLDAISIVAERAVAAVGHTRANAATTRAAVRAGARFATHLWNAMRSPRPRSPGPVLSLLLDERVAIGLIPDGRHLHPLVEELAVRVAGPGRIALTSDRVPPPGHRPDGSLLGGDRSGAAIVRRMARFGLAETAMMASLVPARVLGLEDRGRLAPGFRADLAVLSRELEPQRTLAAGKDL